MQFLYSGGVLYQSQPDKVLEVLQSVSQYKVINHDICFDFVIKFLSEWHNFDWENHELKMKPCAK